MSGRKAKPGGGRKPRKNKNISETFQFKSTVLAFYDTHTMQGVMQTFWPNLVSPSKAYQSKRRVVSRWNEVRTHVEEMASKTKTALPSAGFGKNIERRCRTRYSRLVGALRSHGVPVSAKMLELEALDVAAMYDVPRSVFAASPTWIASFLSRYRLSIRMKTRQGQASRYDSAAVAETFAATVRRRIVDEGITRVYNADQTAIFFEYVPKRTIDSNGATTVWVKCWGKSKERLTAMVMADNTGKKYDPWVVLKMKPSNDSARREENTQDRQGFSRRMFPKMETLEKKTHTKIFSNGKGWWNVDLSLLFLEHHFGDRTELDDPIMLIWDDFSAHWTSNVIAYAAQKSVILQRVPPGYTHCCQPADISWNKPLKDKMRSSWTKYLREECAKVLVPDENKVPAFRAPGRELVLSWLHTAWVGLTGKTVKGGFKRINLLLTSAKTLRRLV